MVRRRQCSWLPYLVDRSIMQRAVNSSCATELPVSYSTRGYTSGNTTGSARHAAQSREIWQDCTGGTLIWFDIRVIYCFCPPERCRCSGTYRFSGGGSNNNLGVAAQAYTAARIADPVRFGNLPSGYFTGGSETARANAFYVGAFDHSIPPLDFATRGTQAVTETLGLPSVQGALDFRGAVHVLTAEFDPQFFNHTANDYTKDRTLLTTTVPNNFPEKSSYQYYVPPNTGHDLDLHYSFPTTVKVLYDSLNPAGSKPRPIPQGAISALPRS